MLFVLIPHTAAPVSWRKEVASSDRPAGRVHLCDVMKPGGGVRMSIIVKVYVATHSSDCCAYFLYLGYKADAW